MWEEWCCAPPSKMSQAVRLVRVVHWEHLLRTAVQEFPPALHQCHSISVASVFRKIRPLFSRKSPSSISNALTHCITKHSTKLSPKETPKHNQSKDICPSELLSASTGSLATAEARCSSPTRPFIHCPLGHYNCQWALNFPRSNLIALIAQF